METRRTPRDHQHDRHKDALPFRRRERNQTRRPSSTNPMLNSSMNRCGQGSRLAPASVNVRTTAPVIATHASTSANRAETRRHNATPMRMADARSIKPGRSVEWRADSRVPEHDTIQQARGNEVTGRDPKRGKPIAPFRHSAEPVTQRSSLRDRQRAQQQHQADQRRPIGRASRLRRAALQSSQRSRHAAAIENSVNESAKYGPLLRKPTSVTKPQGACK